MHISYKPLWHTLIECNMWKEDLRLAACLTTNMIANMGKEGKHISMDTLARICEKLYYIPDLKLPDESRSIPTLENTKYRENLRFCLYNIITVTQEGEGYP